MQLDYDHLIVIDFEATCEEKNYPDYPHEIIEFPAIIIDVQTQQVSAHDRKIERLLRRTRPKP